MKHIWDAIELCHRKLVNERERLSSAQLDEHTDVVASSGATATLDKISAALAEVEAELRAVIAARRDYTEQYGEPSAEPLQ